MEWVDGYWIRGNDTSRHPNSFIVLDTEARRRPVAGGEDQTFRCAVAVSIRRARNGDPWDRWRWSEHWEPESLWRWVSGQARHAGRTVIVAHNASYDVRVGAALVWLPRCGWTMEPPLVSAHNVSFRWRKRNHRLVVVDSMAWLPTALAKIGPLVGATKPADPDGDDDAGWLERCRADVEILAAAWIRLVDWVETEDLGTWKTTGAAQAMTTWRHKHLTHRVIAHTDTAIRAAEREAAWCGRAEAWRTGTMRAGPFTEWDLRLAYCTIMEECAVPTVCRGRARDEVEWRRWVRSPHGVGIASVTVDVDEPVLPARVDGRVCWPVGRFSTVVWDHELALVDDVGGKVVGWHQGWVYDAGPALASFARWCRAILDASAGEVDPVVAVAVKHFTRGIVGKFGTRIWDWELYSPDPVEDGFRVAPWIDAGGERLAMNIPGDGFYHQGPVRDGRNTVPQIMGWIQAETRVRLWRALAAAGDLVLYCDTDGLITGPEGTGRLRDASVPGLREKDRYDQIRILATRQAVLDGRLRASGVPKTGAFEVGPDLWSAEVWTQPLTALRAGDLDTVRIRRRQFQLSHVDRRRTFDRHGRSQPIRLSGDETVAWAGESAPPAADPVTR